VSVGLPEVKINWPRLEAFLRGRWWCVIATTRKDGAPIAVPVGYIYEDGYVYISYASIRVGIQRLRRDPRVSVVICNEGYYPPTAVRIDAIAEEIPDPGWEITKRMTARYVADRDFVDFNLFHENHVSHGRVVFRIPVNPSTTRFQDAKQLHELVASGEASYEWEGAGIIPPHKRPGG
jgi:hypothetical protein